MKIRNIVDRVIHNWPAKILSLCAAIVLSLFFEISKKDEAYFNVPLDILIDENLTPVGQYPASVSVRLEGREDDLVLIEEENVYVFADFSHYLEQGEYEGPVKYAIQGLAEEKIKNIDVRADPSKVVLALDRKISRQIEVIPVITGYPKLGYDLIDYYTVPEKLDIIGPAALMEKITQVKTANVDVSGLEEDFSFRVPLIISEENLIITGEKYVEVYGRIGPAMLTKTFGPLSLIPVQLPDNLKIEDDTLTGTVRVKASQKVINATKSEDFSLLLNCTGISRPGVYRVKVLAIVPMNVELITVNPDEISINVSAQNNVAEILGSGDESQ